MNEDSENTDSIQPDSEEEALLSTIECRVLGTLMEKQLSTPDGYPLTVNSLLSAANQKTNREPVSSYQQGEIVRTLRELESRRLVRYEMGARSEKYEQRFTNEYQLSKKQQALLSVMMLRGPQTANELMTRTQRMCEFSDRDNMQLSLERLTQGESPMVILIPRQTGQREDRYGHILCGDVQMPPPTETVSTTAKSNTEIANLRSEVEHLRQQLETLYQLTGHEIPESEST